VTWDPYLDLQTGVLRNRLGITDRAELARVEASLTASRIYDLQLSRLSGRYDLAHLQAFHRYIFHDVYDWAGELRTVSIGKGAVFCLPQHLVSAASEVFAWLARDRHLRGLGRAEFVDRLTALLADVNALHPFREGNGRTQRAFLAQLARDAGYRIRWAAMDPEANIVASRAAHRGDNAPLRDLLKQIVDSSDEVPPRPRAPEE
jgi:cell filamentation protein